MKASFTTPPVERTVSVEMTETEARLIFDFIGGVSDDGVRCALNLAPRDDTSDRSDVKDTREATDAPYEALEEAFG